MKKLQLFLFILLTSTLFGDNQTYSYSGSVETLTVPNGVTQMTFKIWGAGGAGGTYSNSGGGSGGYSEGTFTVTPGDNLIIAVGGGGLHGTTWGSGGDGGWPGGGFGTSGDATGGGGGSYSGVFMGSHTHSNSLIIAGGGGAGTGFRYGGAGGGTSGNNGQYGGNGGSQTSGGSGTSGDDGSALQGGNGDANGSQNSGSSDGGGGGGGYYGGEGGYSDAKGGGGGSGYYNSTYVVGSGTLTTGNNGSNSGGGSAVNTGYAEYQSGVGVGSNQSSDAGDGLIYVEWSVSDPATAPTTQASDIALSNITGTSMDISWTSGNGSSRAVFVADASSGSASPVDGTTYTASATFESGTQIGSSGWYCIYLQIIDPWMIMLIFGTWFFLPVNIMDPLNLLSKVKAI